MVKTEPKMPDLPEGLEWRVSICGDEAQVSIVSDDVEVYSQWVRYSYPHAFSSRDYIIQGAERLLIRIDQAKRVSDMLNVPIAGV